MGFQGPLYIEILSPPCGPLPTFPSTCAPDRSKDQILSSLFRKLQPANMTAVNTAFTVLSGIGFLLSVIPIYWHLDSWQVGTGMYMIWTALACLVYFVDSIVWSGNAINWAPVWCDISMCTFIRSIPISDGLYSATRIQIAVGVAWPACNICIVRRLYSIASATAVTTTRAQVGY